MKMEEALDVEIRMQTINKDGVKVNITKSSNY